MRKTKIICTIGPVTESIEMLEKLAAAGMNIARLNMSHGSHESHSQIIQSIKTLNKRLDHPVAILLDTQGPEIRTGDMADDLHLNEGDTISIVARGAENVEESSIHINYDDLINDVDVGDTITVDNGLINLEVLEKHDRMMQVKVIDGGLLKSKRHVNLPGIRVNLPAITEKDRRDIEFGMSQGVDFIALSFVREAADIEQLRELLGQAADQTKIIAKLEDQEAITNMIEIIDAADGIMVARGDLGVHLPISKVPSAQKYIINLANKKGKEVITATQMLESMTSSLTPTRAEVSDVANAVFEGADAIMLSAESASGDYPVETVKMMNKIAINIEKDSNYNDILSSQLEDTPDTTPDAIAVAAKTLADELSAPIIVCYTESGSTGIKVSRVRPSQTILTITPVVQTARKLSLAWGVLCFLQKDESDLEHMIKLTKKTVKKSGLAIGGDKVVITAGLPLKVQGTTNLIRVTTVK